MTTVADVLKIGLLSRAKLVAGASGLDQPVRWMHIVEEPDVTRWVRRGVILLTTGQSLAQDPGLQEDIINELTRAELAGIFVATGRHLEHIPRVMQEAGEAHGFPVVDIPWDIPFIDIMQTVHELIVNEQYALLRRSMEIHDTLTQLTLRGGGLEDVAQALAQLTCRAVTIESPTFDLLAYADFGEVDSARRITISARRSSPELVKTIKSMGLTEAALSERRPVQVPSLPEHGMTLDRILAPITVGDELYGYVWLIADEPLGELDKLAIEHGATVAALIMLRERDLRDAENRLRGDLLVRLFHTQANGSAEVASLADQCQLDVRHSHRAIVINLPMPEHPMEANETLHRVEDCARRVGIRIFAGWLGDHLVAIAEVPNGADLSYSFGQALASEWHGVSIGMGSAQNKLTTLGKSYDEAAEALVAGRALTDRNVVCIDDLGFLRWLYHIPEDARPYNPYFEKLTRLIDYDHEHGGELFNTLEAYLDTNGNAVLTAQNLFVHRNTLFYRLKRLEEICDVDFSDPSVRLNLHVAVKAYRLFKHESSHGT